MNTKQPVVCNDHEAELLQRQLRYQAPVDHRLTKGQKHFYAVFGVLSIIIGTLALCLYLVRRKLHKMGRMLNLHQEIDVASPRDISVADESSKKHLYIEETVGASDSKPYDYRVAEMNSMRSETPGGEVSDFKIVSQD